MATAQKRGFRLPWGSDPRPEPPPPEDRHDAGDANVADLARRIGATSDELGEGPFGLSGAASSEADASGAVATATSDLPEAIVEPAVEPAGETPDESSPADALMEAAALDDRRASWPESDRRTTGPLAAIRGAATAMAPRAASRTPASPAPAALPVASPAAASPRRDNPLVAGLVRAMRDAARTARDEALTSLHAEAATHGEAIRAQSAVTTSELKKAAEGDVAAVKEWSRAELARVREETDARIAARRTQLVAEIEAEARAAEARLGSLRSTIEAFESEMAAFFEVLLAEDDPARLAGLAERMPATPALEGLPAADETVTTSVRPRRAGQPKATPPRVRRPEVVEVMETAVTEAADVTEAGDVTEAAGATEPELGPEAVIEPEPEPERTAHASPEASPTDDTVAGAIAVEAMAVDAMAADATAVDETTPEGAGQAEPSTDSPRDGRAGWLEHLDPDTAAAAEAEALAGLDVQTQLVVTGLASVAGIAAFKGALMLVGGVNAVSVSAGAAGEVLFAVTHDGQTELRDALRGLEAFETQVIADDGVTVSLVAREIPA